MLSAAVSAAAVFRTGVSMLAMLVVVMAALRIRIISEVPGKQRLHRRVAGAADAAVERDAGLGQRRLRTAADPAADKRVHMQAAKQRGQRAVAGAIRAYQLLGQNFAVAGIIDLELRRVTEVLKDLSVFISYCNYHRYIHSFPGFAIGSPIAVFLPL